MEVKLEDLYIGYSNLELISHILTFFKKIKINIDNKEILEYLSYNCEVDLDGYSNIIFNDNMDIYELFKHNRSRVYKLFKFIYSFITLRYNKNSIILKNNKIFKKFENAYRICLDCQFLDREGCLITYNNILKIKNEEF